MELKNSPSTQSNSSEVTKRFRLQRGSSTTNTVLITTLAVVLIVVLVGGALLFTKYKKDSVMNSVKKDQYQAVFLTNGQVYFGKIAEASKTQLKLTNIYYLQVQQSVQPAEQKNNQSQISLAKLGDELHGPEDTMYIAKDQMLFWENLKDNGKVVQAIKSAGQK